MGSETAIPLDKLVKTYIKIRDRRSELKAEFDKEDSILVEQLDAVKGALLEHCKEHDVSSVKTSEGLFYRTVKQTYWTSDWESLYQCILENNVPQLLEQRIHNSNMRQFLEENPNKFPAGLQNDRKYAVQVRKPTAK